jgi:hypothetical protein
MDQTPYTPPQPPPPPISSGYSTIDKPGKITTIGVLTLVSGASNILWSVLLTAVVVLGSMGFGVICAPLTLLPLVLGIFEILYGMKLVANPPQPARANQTLAILEIVAVLTGNMISLAAGILALVFYNEPDVKAYFSRFGA